jgi:hypothetical protein
LQVPLTHVPPVQHGSPLEPQRAHCPVEHTVDVVSVHGVAPVQHGSSIPPQVVQVLVVGLQISWNVEVEAGHVSPGQQGSPSSPQLEQVLVESQKSGNVVSDEGQLCPGQQGSPSLPHDSQKPSELLHTSVSPPVEAQMPPGATQVLVVPWLLQHPPPVHWSLQQGSPAAPHDWHVPPAPEQTLLPPEQVEFGKTQVLFAGSQQPSWHAAPVVQHALPL